MGGIREFLARRKALKMGKSASAAAGGAKTSAEAAYDRDDFFSRSAEVEDRNIAQDESFRRGVSDNPFSR